VKLLLLVIPLLLSSLAVAQTPVPDPFFTDAIPIAAPPVTHPAPCRCPPPPVCAPCPRPVTPKPPVAVTTWYTLRSYERFTPFAGGWFGETVYYWQPVTFYR